MATHPGDILLERGDRTRRIFVVVSGSLELLLQGRTGEESINVLMPGDFSGEMSALRVSVGFVRIRVEQGGIVIAIDAEHLQALVQTDAELSEIFMRAFILRRMGILSAAGGDVMLIGSRHSADTLRLQEFLTRNAYPYVNVDVESDADVKDLLERFHVPVEDIPVVVCRAQRVFKNPTNHEVAECLGMNPEVDDSVIHDLLIVGAGPAGLAAAVYAASEGLDTRIVETIAAGGQAGSSSKIENYLGFPMGTDSCAQAPSSLQRALNIGFWKSKTFSAFSGRASTMPPRIWRPNSARARKSPLSAGPIRPARPPFSWPIPVAMCTFWSARAVWLTACPAT